MNKKKKLKFAIFIFCWFLAVIFFAANIAFTQSLFLYNTLNSLFGGERRVLVSGNPEAEEYQYYKADYADKAQTLAAANALNERIAEEGIILLKNENALPIKTPVSDAKISAKPKISVFGHNSVNLVYGGSGSGGSSSKGATTLYESLTAAGYEYNPTLKAFYESNAAGSVRGQPSMGDNTLAGIKIGETPAENYTDAVKNSYANYNDAALVVLSRLGGEGFDLPRTMKTSLSSKGTKIEGARNMDDHYLQIDKNEVDMLREAIENFDKIIVVVNSSEAMELGFLDDPAHYLYTDGGYADSVGAETAMNKLKGAVWIGSPGKTGINALGRVLNGSVNPSGRTVDTYARNFKNDPTYNNFGTNNELSGNELYALNKNGKLVSRAEYIVEYEEGIYVGYRYYETRYETEGANGDQWYKNNVVYPFGYGLSYSSFDWEIVDKPQETLTLNGDTEITVRVKVTNTTDVAGKDVVQVYYEAPYYDGEIEKSSTVLAGFAKTKLLERAGDSDVVTVTFSAYDMASYDYSDANKNGHKGYELDGGNYKIKVCRNAHETADEITYNLAEGVRYETNADGKEVVNRFDDVSEGISTYLSRSDWEKTWPQPPTLEERTVTQEFLDSLKYDGVDEGKKWEANSTPTQSANTVRYEDAIKLYELRGADYDDELWDGLLDQLTVSTMARLIGTGNYNTMAIDCIGKPKTLDPDGPVGFTAFMGDPSVYDTCFYVSGCVVAATYNVDLACEMGKMIGNEGIIGNEAGDGTPYSGWYAPAVNIHRSPFSGRNWEYYSEDGLLSGKMAANTVQGAKSKGVYTYVKHFALNDQETNRNGILTYANEQSMRELYFKPFELTVTEGGTTAMMSSFNRIGKVWTGGSYELLTEVLRGEWGFKGMVITDYNYATPYMNVNQMIRAGGDLNLSQEDRPGTAATPTQITSLRRATKNILYTVVNSNAMNGYGDGVVYKYVMPVWTVWMLVADAVVVLAMGGWTFFLIYGEVRSRKKRAVAEETEVNDVQTP